MDFLKLILTSDPFIAAVVAAIFAAVGAIAKRVWDLLGRRVSAADLEVMRQIAERSVIAVEQTMKTAEGQAKLDAAMELASKQLLAYRIRVDHDQLKAAVEASVALAKVKLQLPPPPPAAEPSGG